MGRRKKVVPTADDPGDVEEQASVDEEDEDSGRGLLAAVSTHVVDHAGEEEEEDDDEEDAAKQGERKSGKLNALCATVGLPVSAFCRCACMRTYIREHSTRERACASCSTC